MEAAGVEAHSEDPAGVMQDLAEAAAGHSGDAAPAGLEGHVDRRIGQNSLLVGVLAA